MIFFKRKGCAECPDSKNNVTPILVGPKGDDGKDATFAAFPKNAVMYYDGTLVEFNADFPAGLGIGKWDKWAWMNGTGTVRDTRGKVIVGYSDTDNDYNDFGKTGGAKTATIAIVNLPAHKHEIIDNGHVHTLVDDEHHHETSIADHNHSASSDPHAHNGTAQSTGSAHPHTFTYGTLNYDDGGLTSLSPPGQANNGTAVSQIDSGGAHEHPLTIDPTTVSIQIDNATLSINNPNAASNITMPDPEPSNIDMQNTGGGSPLDIRQGYITMALIKKIAD